MTTDPTIPPWLEPLPGEDPGGAPEPTQPEEPDDQGTS